jgi:hypothetical protein
MDEMNDKARQAQAFRQEITGRRCEVSGCDQPVTVIAQSASDPWVRCYLCRTHGYRAKAGTLEEHPPMTDRSPAAEADRALMRALNPMRWGRMPWW